MKSELSPRLLVGRGARRRRFWSSDEKRRMVAESFEPGASVSTVAQRYGVNANLLFTWSRKMGVEASVRKDPMPILPVTIARGLATERDCPGAAGQMEIVLAEGGRIIVWADVETAALTRVLKALSRR